MTGLPSGTVSLLFSDIEGSTALLSRLGPVYAEALDGQRRLLRQAWASHGGTELGTEGDSFFVVFTTAASAVAAAAQAQREMAGHSWPQGHRVRVRMGIHTGSPTIHDGGYVGMDVHRAARIAAAAHGGQTLISEASARLVDGALPSGVQLLDLGSHQLKDIAMAERLFQLAVDGLQVDFPPLRTLGTASSLPLQATPLVGRDGELAELTALLRLNATRLLTLTGPGGSGKTRLAVALAQALVAAFPDGVFFVPLAAVTVAEEMWASVAESVGASSNGRSRMALLSHVAQLKSVIVLDNLEQLPDAAAVVSELLSNAPGVVVVATSRRPLHLTGEHEHPVPPLQLPDDVDLTLAQGSGGVQMFVQHARMVRPDFTLTEDNVAAVSAICRRLDGLPLAIEFAAARCKLLSPAALLARLDKTTGLRARDVARPSRQQTLHAAMAWSYDLLSPEQKTFFRQLGIFADSADLDAVAAVLSTDVDPLEGIEELVDASLAVVDEDPDGEPRVALLQTVRDFALERLADAGELEQLAARHALHYTQLAEGLAPGLWTNRYLSCRDRLETEHANILEALTWCLRPDAHDPPPSDRARLGLRLCSLLSWFWLWRGGYRTEATRWLQRAIELADEEGPELAAALHGLAAFLADTHDAVSDEELLRRALTIYRRLDDRSSASMVLRTIGDRYRTDGDLDRARDAHEESVALARAAGDRRQLAAALAGLSMLEGAVGNHQECIDLITEARDIVRALGDERGEVLFANNRACALMAAGRTHEALAELEAVVSALLRLRNAWANYYVVSSFADVYARLGEHRRAVRLLGASDAIGDWLGTGPTPEEQADWDEQVAEIRKHLSPGEWEAIYQAGRASSAEDVVLEIQRALPPRGRSTPLSELVSVAGESPG